MFSHKMPGFTTTKTSLELSHLTVKNICFFFKTNMAGNCPKVSLKHPAVTRLQMLKRRHELQLLAWQPSYNYSTTLNVNETWPILWKC